MPNLLMLTPEEGRVAFDYLLKILLTKRLSNEQIDFIENLENDALSRSEESAEALGVSPKIKAYVLQDAIVSNFADQFDQAVTRLKNNEISDPEAIARINSLVKHYLLSEKENISQYDFKAKLPAAVYKAILTKSNYKTLPAEDLQALTSNDLNAKFVAEYNKYLAVCEVYLLVCEAQFRRIANYHVPPKDVKLLLARTCYLAGCSKWSAEDAIASQDVLKILALHSINPLGLLEGFTNKDPYKVANALEELINDSVKQLNHPKVAEQSSVVEVVAVEPPIRTAPIVSGIPAGHGNHATAHDQFEYLLGSLNDSISNLRKKFGFQPNITGEQFERGLKTAFIVTGWGGISAAGVAVISKMTSTAFVHSCGAFVISFAISASIILLVNRVARGLINKAMAHLREISDEELEALDSASIFDDEESNLSENELTESESVVSLSEDEQGAHDQQAKGTKPLAKKKERQASVITTVTAGSVTEQFFVRVFLKSPLAVGSVIGATASAATVATITKCSYLTSFKTVVAATVACGAIAAFTYYLAVPVIAPRISMSLFPGEFVLPSHRESTRESRDLA
jgi:hypothetical protein